MCKFAYEAVSFQRQETGRSLNRGFGLVLKLTDEPTPNLTRLLIAGVRVSVTVIVRVAMTFLTTATEVLGGEVLHKEQSIAHIHQQTRQL